jgi:hypothetical protein
LVAAGKRVSEPFSNTRLAIGDHIADVLLDTRKHAEVYHWIVQKAGSPEVVYWGQESTFEEAKAAAQSYLQSLNRGQKKKA